LLGIVAGSECGKIAVFGEQILKTLIDNLIGRSLDEGGILIDLDDNGIVKANIGGDSARV
jgi:hypothetical protein